MIDLAQIKLDLGAFCNVIFCEAHPVIAGLMTLEIDNITDQAGVDNLIATIKTQYSGIISQDYTDGYFIGRYTDNNYTL